jgi:hypothetical protein
VIGPPEGARGTATPLSRRVCDQDHIVPYAEGTSRRVVSCDLGRFFPVSEEQALQILTALGGSAATASEADASDAQ